LNYFWCIINSHELKHADKAQQAFSSDRAPSLFNAIPAIETLHAAWSSRAEKNKYHAFKPALDAATTKLNGYYQKTAESDAHILVMCSFVITLYFFLSKS
jgi:hypothetical protein